MLTANRAPTPPVGPLSVHHSPLIQSTTCCGLHLLTDSISPQIFRLSDLSFLRNTECIRINQESKRGSCRATSGTSGADAVQAVRRSAALCARHRARAASLQMCCAWGGVSGYRGVGHAPSPRCPPIPRDAAFTCWNFGEV